VEPLNKMAHDRSFLLISMCYAVVSQFGKPQGEFDQLEEEQPLGRSLGEIDPIPAALMAGYRRVDENSSFADLSSVYAWDPPVSSSSWYSQNWEALYPRCTQDEEWCDSRHLPQDTDAVQRAIHAHQNPQDCSRARFLVLSTEHSSGLGSSLHIHAYMISLAISDNRVLVIDPAVRWDYVPKGLCSCDDIEELPKTCKPGTVLSDCFFLPASRCPLPSGWESAPKFALGKNDLMMQARSSDEHFGISQCDVMVLGRKMKRFFRADAGERYRGGGVDSNKLTRRLSWVHIAGVGYVKEGADTTAKSPAAPPPTPPPPTPRRPDPAAEGAHRIDRAAAADALAVFVDRPSSWWLAQLVKYILRPRPRVLRDIVAPMQLTAFTNLSSPSGFTSHPSASVFIPRGDKMKQARRSSFQTYFAELEPIEHSLWVDSCKTAESRTRAYPKAKEKLWKATAASWVQERDWKVIPCLEGSKRGDCWRTVGR
jgi:hypothetical protein